MNRLRAQNLLQLQLRAVYVSVRNIVRAITLPCACAVAERVAPASGGLPVVSLR